MLSNHLVDESFRCGITSEVTRQPLGVVVAPCITSHVPSHRLYRRNWHWHRTGTNLRDMLGATQKGGKGEGHGKDPEQSHVHDG